MQILIVVAILLLVGLIHVLIEIVKATGEGLDAAAKGVDNFSTSAWNHLGRKNPSVLQVPEILASAPRLPENFRSWEQQVANLRRWKADFGRLPDVEISTYQSPGLSTPKSFCFELLEHEIGDILIAEENRPSVYSVLRDLIRYPKYPALPPMPDPPRKPSPIPFLSIDIPEPKLELPLYTGVKSLLNSFVHEAHAKELATFQAATAMRSEMIAIAERANAQISAENADALDRWRRATEAHSDATKRLRDIHAFGRLRFEAARQKDLTDVDLQEKDYERCVPEAVERHFDLVLRTIVLPGFIPRKWRLRYDAKSRILVVDHQFPDLARLRVDKVVSLKTKSSRKPVSQKTRKELLERLQPALSIRLASEIAQSDPQNALEAITINGWAEFIDRRTGEDRVAYCSTLFARKTDILALKLSRLDPISAFRSLKGNYSNETYEVTPVAPVMRLDTSDPRFVPPREVLGKLAEGENLAAMDWGDFEHLIREAFERVFSFPGAEVKVTQASRDKGVDAVIFDPDPVRGGKIIIQAKRYTNTVDVSAVRDLYGAVLNEGAIKGILVTTSHFGTDAYSFATGKPLTLLNGAELLGLLQQHGYKFRIDIEEARRLAGTSSQPPN